MKLKGKVLKRFADSQDGNKIYAPTGTVDIAEYTGKKITYPDVYEAEQKRYEELEAKGYVSEGQAVEFDEKPKERRSINTDMTDDRFESSRKLEKELWR